ncbi:hypothetical protein ONE63_000831 [Megalurothrips usitatus]|uniref:Uncharacterized protein n=1 Tax=Megalurothrips usitatus TaxID=439358 RepID=A0AAV7XZP8_9NEOP|nr:hypothetical protein ONE63_000831 [Megalurothrips usitatus]
MPVNTVPRMKPLRVHGTVVPEIDDSFSPQAIDYVGNIMMNGLSCPFTWNAFIPPNPEDVAILVDRLPLASSDWESMIQKCHLAFIFSSIYQHEKASALISECFMPLLEVPGLETDDVMPREYRQAWRYLLDSTSAFIRKTKCEDYEDRHILYEFVKTIPWIDHLNNKQKAAIFAIRSRCIGYPESESWIREALKLNSEEGLWHYYLAETLHEAVESGFMKLGGKTRHDALEDVLRHNQIALSLRGDTPEPYFLMANLLVQFGDPKASQKSYICVQNAIKQFPNNAWVHEKAAEILQQSQPSFSFMPKSYLLIEPFYKKALKLAGKDCLSLRHNLGKHQVMFGQLKIENYEGIHDEGIKNLELASKLIPDAYIHLQAARQGKLTPSSVGLAPFLFREEYCSSEESQPESKSLKKKNKSKKKKKR